MNNFLRSHLLLPNSPQFSPVAYSTSITAAYFLFYTAYDKTTQKLSLKLLLDVVLFRKGTEFSLKEINKVISLAGITGLLTAFYPELEYTASRELLFISMNMLWAHSAYSFYKFYDCNPRKVIADKWMKRLSVVLGSLGQAALALGYWKKISPSNLILSATALSIAHFVTMEMDFKYRLQVRPFAYLPFPVAAGALYKFFFPK
jgi:hypothetical protein